MQTVASRDDRCVPPPPDTAVTGRDPKLHKCRTPIKGHVDNLFLGNSGPGPPHSRDF
jgi:hypothetical protein